MIIVKANSYKGKQLTERGSHYEGKYLYQVYNSWSPAKQRAWDWCYDEYLSDNGEGFSIVSHNTFGFSVSWFTEKGMRYETPQNSYLVIFED